MLCLVYQYEYRTQTLQRIFTREQSVSGDLTALADRNLAVYAHLALDGLRNPRPVVILRPHFGDQRGSGSVIRRLLQ